MQNYRTGVAEMEFDSEGSASVFHGRAGVKRAVRTFVCVCMGEDGMNEIAGFIGELKKFTGFKWAARDTLHITLKFLGEIEPERVTRLDTNLSRIGGIRPFKVTLSGVGAFPNLSSPRVLWVGVAEGSEETSKLAASVDKAAVASGFEEERRAFHPHLTLARARTDSRARGLVRMPDELAEKLKSCPLPSWTCDGFMLMRSELSSSGPTYTPIAKFYF